MQPDCLFCKIVRGEIPSEKVYENDSVYAFLDIHPINKGHALVIPKKHADSIHDMATDEFCALMEVVRTLSPIIREAVEADATNIGINNGSAAGQVVFHAHVHIIPRVKGDGHEHWHGEDYRGSEAEETAFAIRAAITANTA